MLDDLPGAVCLPLPSTNCSPLLLKFCCMSYKHNSDETANSFLNHDVVSQNTCCPERFLVGYQEQKLHVQTQTHTITNWIDSGTRVWGKFLPWHMARECFTWLCMLCMLCISVKGLSCWLKSTFGSVCWGIMGFHKEASKEKYLPFSSWPEGWVFTWAFVEATPVAKLNTKLKILNCYETLKSVTSELLTRSCECDHLSTRF